MHIRIVCIVGKKKSGKTTFLEALIPALEARGLSVGTVKHDAHSFEMDREGKDSWRHRQAGARSVVVSSPTQLALIKQVERERSLAEIAAEFMADRDVVLTEGYYRSAFPKVEVHRGAAHAAPLTRAENAGPRNVLALATDVPLELGVPCFGLDEAPAVARFLVQRLF
jgi:molybdopterin-guanine dinucleotide biosynthesis protein B